MDNFPLGTFVAMSPGGTILGAASTLVLDYNLDRPIPTWNEATGNGFIANHDPSGNMLYGVDLSVLPNAEGAASVLMDHAKELVLELGLDGGLLGARLPRYARVSGAISAEDYVRLAINRESKRLNSFVIRPDPEVMLYQEWFDLQVLCVLPEYYDDSDSLNYGVLMLWPNPQKN
jgi:hypothetical protein